MSLQQRFYDDVKEALSIAGFSSAARTMSRGDGLLLLLPAEQADIGPLVGFLLHLQRLIVDQRSAEAPLQVRVAVTQGTATAGENGWYGASLNTAARMLDAAPLRATIGSPAVRLAVAVSEEVHDEVRRLKPRGFRPEFDPAQVVTRHGDIPMWIYTAKIPV
ncbi:hypothetical protein ACFYY2_34015 [Streptomyces sp. NPDC001822]|uniref:hypothetical protein n=1 Tax=Streptomyces sp. NPDC001822 TaxID=3364614 RepID=UPI0036C62544